MLRPNYLGTTSSAGILYYIGTLVAALIALNISYTSVAKAEGAGCVTIEALATDVAEKYPDKESLRLEGDEAALFMSEYNAMPPATNFVATGVLMLFHEEVRAVRIAFFKNNCVVALSTQPINKIRALLRKALG